jgi:hypothetical protein
MQKVVKLKPCDVISVCELVNKIDQGDVVVFYKTGNEPNGNPVFLKCFDTYVFVSPVLHNGNTYKKRKNESLEDFLTRILSERQLYVSDRFNLLKDLSI